MLYAALPGEIPLDLVSVHARREGKRVLFPRMVSASELVLAEAVSVEDLRPGRYGVPEPTAEASAEPLGDDSLVLVPGAAFDPTGGRLGRGRGVWDRALGERRGASVFGGAFELLAVVDLDAWKEDAPRIAKGALGRMKRGHWDTTTANAWGVLRLREVLGEL